MVKRLLPMGLAEDIHSCQEFSNTMETHLGDTRMTGIMQVEIRTCDIISLVDFGSNYGRIPWTLEWHVQNLYHPQPIQNSKITWSTSHGWTWFVFSKCRVNYLRSSPNLHVQLASIHRISWRISTKISISPSQPKIIHVCSIFSICFPFFPFLTAFPKFRGKPTTSTIYLPNSH